LLWTPLWERVVWKGPELRIRQSTVGLDSTEVPKKTRSEVTCKPRTREGSNSKSVICVQGTREAQNNPMSQMVGKESSRRS
jgi:hypothetical protein